MVKGHLSEARAECTSKTCKYCPQLMSFMAKPGLAGFAARHSITASSSHSIMSDAVYCITSLKASASTGGNLFIHWDPPWLV